MSSSKAQPDRLIIRINVSSVFNQQPQQIVEQTPSMQDVVHVQTPALAQVKTAITPATASSIRVTKKATFATVLPDISSSIFSFKLGHYLFRDTILA